MQSLTWPAKQTGMKTTTLSGPVEKMKGSIWPLMISYEHMSGMSSVLCSRCMYSGRIRWFSKDMARSSSEDTSVASRTWTSSSREAVLGSLFAVAPYRGYLRHKKERRTLPEARTWHNTFYLVF